MEPETIVVPGPGMARWLSMELSRRFGVWANPAFPFPRALIERALDAIVPHPKNGLEFIAESLQWSVATALTDMLETDPFVPLRRYVGDDDSGARRLQLCARIADVFDRYAIYRPEMVLSWERGEASGANAPPWQPLLWREVVARHRPHMAARVRAFLQASHEDAGPVPDFPGRICLFGLSTLPPLYMDVLAGLSRRVSVHLFLLAPSDQYFADLRASRDRARAGDDARSEGHPLLASLGRVARDFQQVLEARLDYREGGAVFEPPEGHTLLARLQGDLLRVERNPDPASLDDSVRVHSCHAPLREVQVVRDQLLDAFQADPSLRPRDVIVMAPDIERYTPYVEAVFGAVGAAIPYRIADRSVRTSYGVVDAFLRVLETVAGRLTAPAVVDLLNFESVRARFSIEPEEVGTIRGWVDELGIRWGEDERHRESCGQPAYREHTWRFGLDRLLIGYAMDDAELWEGVLPFADAEGSAGDLAGRLVELVESLFRLRARLAGRQSVAEWCELLAASFEDIIVATDSMEHQAREIRDALSDLRRRSSEAGFAAPVDLEPVVRQLERYFRRRTTVGDFLAGGVTFCAMVPMRTIPFKVVCLMGLDHDTFPRNERPPGFSLLASSPRPGDRSPREDDRYLFLEAILAARERLVITYVGQGIQDDRARPPSVLVDELLDEIEGIAEEGPEAGRQRVTIAHPIQPFSIRYFSRNFGQNFGGNRELFSYSQPDADGARALVGDRGGVPEFVGGGLDASEVDVVSVDELAAFFRDPCRVFAQRQLGLYLGHDEVVLRGREPIELDPLERWTVGDPEVSALMARRPLDEVLRRLRAGGRVPPGSLARYELDQIVPLAQRVVDEARPLLSEPRLPAKDVRVQVGDVHVVAHLADLRATGFVRRQYSQVSGRNVLPLWIRHLVLCADRPGDIEPASVLVARGSADQPTIVRLDEPEDPKIVLASLLDLYRAGQSVPLPLFRESSWSYARQLFGGKEPEQALARARRLYEADRGDPYVRQLFSGSDPIGNEPVAEGGVDVGFASVAWTVYQPLLCSQRGLA